MAKKVNAEKLPDMFELAKKDASDPEFNFALYYFFLEEKSLRITAKQAFALYDNFKNINERGIPEKIHSILATFPKKTKIKELCTSVDNVIKKHPRDREVLLESALCCWLAANAIVDNQKMKNEEMSILFVCILLITNHMNEAIGYWTARLKIKNPGAEKMKEMYKNRTEMIREILEEMNIKDTGIFRTEKTKREKFFNKAKEKTGLTSEDRILKISRFELKKKNLKS